MNLDFDKICRLCLRCCEDYIDLHQNNGAKSLSTEIMKTINSCYGVQIDLSESLPNKVCLQCVQVLTFFYTTKNNVMTSEQLLKNILCIRNEYDSNKSKCDRSKSVEMIKVDEKGNRSDDVEIIKIVNKTTQNDISPHENKLHNLDYNNTLESCHSAEIEESAKNLALKKKTKMKSVKKKNKSHSKKGNKLKNNRKKRNIEFSLRHRCINKLKFISAKRKISPASNKGRKEKGNRTERISSRNFKVIGTVIDVINILSPGIKRLKKTTNQQEQKIVPNSS